MTSWRAIAPVALASSSLLLAGGSAHASVLVVGDSLAVGTEPALRAALPSAEVEADVRNGRLSGEGVSILRDRLRTEHDTVVFDLGTNDGPHGVDATARSLQAARALAGGRCLVVATLNHPPVGGMPIDAQNAMIRDFVATTPNAALVDWHGAAGSPGLLQSDGVHATSAGYALRGALFAEAIQGCSSIGAPGGPAVGGPGASTTDRPAGRRRKRRPPPPPFEVRLATALGDWLSSAAPRELMSGAGTVLTEAAASLVAVLTPRGPEPVLGAPDGSL